MVEFCGQEFCGQDDNDDAITAANVEGRLSIMTIMLTVV